MATLSLMQRVSPSEEFDRYIHLFTTHCRALNYAPRTVDDFYRYEFKALRRYLDEHNPDLSPTEMTTEVIRDFLAPRQQSRSNVHGIVGRYSRYGSSFYRKRDWSR